MLPDRHAYEPTSTEFSIELHSDGGGRMPLGFWLCQEWTAVSLCGGKITREEAGSKKCEQRLGRNQMLSSGACSGHGVLHPPSRVKSQSPSCMPRLLARLGDRANEERPWQEQQPALPGLTLHHCREAYRAAPGQCLASSSACTAACLGSRSKAPREPTSRSACPGLGAQPQRLLTI